VAWFRRSKVSESWMRRLGAGPWNAVPSSPYHSSVDVSESLSEAIGAHKLAGGGAYVWQWAVHTCVDFLAKNIAQTNLKAYRKTDGAPEPLDRDHRLSRVIQRPNPQTTRFGLIRGTVADLAIYDEAFWLWKSSRGGEDRLYQLPACFVEAKDTNLLTGPDHYTLDTGTGSGPRRFEVDEIIHFHGYNPQNPHAGRSPLKSLATLLVEEREASRYMGRLLAKGMRFGGFLGQGAGQAPLSETALKRFMEGLRAFSRGGDREGEWMLLEEGIEPKQSSFSPHDAELMALREFVLDIVMTAYHIPLSTFSRTKQPTFASAKEFHKSLYTDTFGPWNSMIEGGVWLQLIPKFEDPDLYVEFNIGEKLQGDFEQTAAAFRQATQVPHLSVNGSLKILNLPPVGDPNDADNPYNWPARPKNYEYGDPSEPQPEAPTLAVAATNGHADLEAAARLEQLALERILEDR